MTVPRVSVVMNIRNGATTLREAIDSVLAQTVTDWELIVWDDWSTDDSASIVKSCGDPRIRYFFSPEETKLGRARELAVREARGEWVAFLDQDDVWLPRKLEQQLATGGDDPAVGLIYGRAVTFTERGPLRDKDHVHEFEPLPEGDIFERLFSDSCFIAMSAAMLRREALRPVPDAIEMIVDYYWFVDVARRYRARAVQSVVCLYRIHGGNMTSSTLVRMQDEFVWMFDRWCAEVDDSLLAHRRRVHQTVAAFEQLKRVRSAAEGFARLVRMGSIPYLIARPLVRAGRSFRRALMPAEWQRDGNAVNTQLEMTPRRVPVLGTDVSATSFDGAASTLDRMVREQRAGYVSCANVFSVMLARDDAGYRKMVNGASFVTADGMPVVWVLRLLGYRAERVHNDDLFLACCARFPEWSHFFVGGREGQAEEVAREVRRRFPHARIDGVRSTPVRPIPESETAEIVAAIRASGASIVWVGMGTPAQDLWMSTACRAAGIPMVGVGSLFDLLTGRTRPAPAWMKGAGLQWLYRLMQEPRRLARRYGYYNPRFVVAIVRQVVRQTFGRRAHQ